MDCLNLFYAISGVRFITHVLIYCLIVERGRCTSAHAFSLAGSGRPSESKGTGRGRKQLD
jgi:hypothetical protein